MLGKQWLYAGRLNGRKSGLAHSAGEEDLAIGDHASHSLRVGIGSTMAVLCMRAVILPSSVTIAIFIPFSLENVGQIYKFVLRVVRFHSTVDAQSE